MPAPIVDQGAIGDVIWGNQIGVIQANGVGISVSSSNNVIGGTALPNIVSGSVPPAIGNIVQGNTTAGIMLSGAAGSGNLVDGNELLDNQGDGILVETSNNLIGETAGNLISGNRIGVHIVGATSSANVFPAQGNVVQKNLIGVNSSATLATIPTTSTQPNLLDGVRIDDARGDVVLSNLIADNSGDGVNIENVFTTVTTANVVQGNQIGYNLDGINISSSGNFIGGTGSSLGNTIVGNQRNGITITSDLLNINNVETNPIANAVPTGNLVQGNLIGTNGTLDEGNTLEGILIADAAGNTIGGTATGAGNVISGNNIGVRILNAAATGNLLEGNLIGTTSSGETILPNAVDGVRIENAPGNTIGGTATGAANVISGNRWACTLPAAGATGNIVQGNFIGSDLQGTTNLRNAIDGVLIDQGASNNTIGGTSMAAWAHIIAFNINNGVDVVGVTTTGDSILSNHIFGNGLLGIDLGDDGVTPNHATATPGPNNFQTFPVNLSIATSGTSLIIGGTLNSVPSTSFLVQFFSNDVAASSGYGAGQKLFGSTTVVTTASGSVSFNAKILAFLLLGSQVSATATNLMTGDTSEFSLDLPYVAIAQLSSATYTVSETGGAATIIVTRNSGSSTSAVDYATGGGSAVAGVNYTATSGTLVFGPGQTSESFSIPVLQDFEITGPLTVGIALSNATQGSLGTPSTAVLTINNVDTPGALDFASATMILNAGATEADVTVQRVGGAGGTVSVAYATGVGTAVPGTDYTPESGVLTFNPGVTSETIVVPILQSPAGSNKTFSLVLSSPTNGATSETRPR